MKYKLENGKEININDKEIEVLAKTLNISEEEAIQVWLEDNEYKINEEVEELTKKAKDNRITATIHQAKGKEGKKREVKRKEDPDKEWIISQLADALGKLGISYKVTNIGKIIEFQYNDEEYKLDLVKRRKGKE